MRIFRIYNNRTKKWSVKDTWQWSDRIVQGYNNIGYLRNHLGHITKYDNKFLTYRSGDCDIVEYELVEVGRFPLKEFIEDSEKKRYEDRLKKEISMKKEKDNKRYEEYLKLKQEFEGNES